MHKFLYSVYCAFFRFCVVMHVLICILELTGIATNSASYLVIFMHEFSSLHLRGVFFCNFHAWIFISACVHLHAHNFIFCVSAEFVLK